MWASSSAQSPAFSSKTLRISLYGDSDYFPPYTQPSHDQLPACCWPGRAETEPARLLSTISAPAVMASVVHPVHLVPAADQAQPGILQRPLCWSPLLVPPSSQLWCSDPVMPLSCAEISAVQAPHELVHFLRRVREVRGFVPSRLGPRQAPVPPSLWAMEPLPGPWLGAAAPLSGRPSPHSWLQDRASPPLRRSLAFI